MSDQQTVKVEIIENLQRFYKHLKLFISELPQSVYPKRKELVSNILIKVINEKLTKYKKELNELDESDNMIDKIKQMKLYQYIKYYTRLVEYGQLRDDNDNISTDSIETGLDIHSDKDFYILPGLRLTDTWIFMNQKQKVIDPMNHMYYAGLHLTMALNDYTKLDKDVKLSYIQYTTQIRGKANLLKEVIKDGIETNETTEDLDGSINVSNLIIDDTINNLEKNGIKDDHKIDKLEKIMTNPNAHKSLKETHATLKKHIETGKIKKENITDIAGGVLNMYKEMPEMKNNKEMRIMMNTMVAQMNAQAAKHKLDKHARKMLNDINKTFKDDSLPIDKNFMNIMNQDMRKSERLAKLQRKKAKLEIIKTNKN